MPHISAYDLTFDSDEEDFMEDNGKKKKDTMLIDDILEEYDAKLEQEKAQKLREERLKSGEVNESLDDFTDNPRMTSTTSNEAPEDSLFNSDIPLENTYKPNLPLTRFGTQSTLEKKLASLSIPRNTFGIHTSLTSSLISERSQPNSKVFVRISDCAQAAAPIRTAAPIRVRIREGSVTEMEPDEDMKPVGKPKNNSSALKPEALGKLEDPFSDLPSDLLPGLYELPNLGFNESTTATSMNTDNKQASGSTIPNISKVVRYEKNIHTYSKSPDTTVKHVDNRLANVHVQRSDLLNAPRIKVEPLDSLQMDEVEGGQGEMKQLGIEDDDGSYVVIVIPKHATVEDVMRTLKTAGNEAGQSGLVRKIVSSKRKSSFRSTRKTVVKKRRLEDTASPTVMSIDEPTIVKEEPKSDLNASCTLAAMSMLVAAEKGICNVPVGSDTVPVVQPDQEVITITDSVEDAAECYTEVQVTGLDQFRKLNPEAQHIEFGLFNDHTYAIADRYVVPNQTVRLPVEELVPDAAAIVTVKTEDAVMEDIEEALDVKKAFYVKEEVQVKQEEVEVANVKVEVMPTEKTEAVAPETEVVAEEAGSQDISHDDVSDDLFCRRSHRLSLKKLPRWGTGNSKRNSKALKSGSKRHQQAKSNFKKKEDTDQVRTVESKHQETTTANKKSNKLEDTVKWHLFASKLRCRLCEVMCHQLIDMKHHIVQVHSNQEASGVTTRQRVTRGKKTKEIRVLSSDVLSDFEASALSAIVRLCPTCDKYVPENRIGNHLENHASLKVTCGVCGAAFKNKTKLGIHTEICCCAKTECKCKMCGKEYSSKSDLSMHQRFHHQNRQKKKKKFHCGRCDKVCRSTGALKVHVAIHFTVKPFECPDCGKGFSQKINMEYHKKVHVGDLPYHCDMCKEGFAQNVSLKTHKKKKHGIDMLRKRKL